MKNSNNYFKQNFLMHFIKFCSKLVPQNFYIDVLIENSYNKYNYEYLLLLVRIYVYL
jgi:hypothetical protein